LPHKFLNIFITTSPEPQPSVRRQPVVPQPTGRVAAQQPPAHQVCQDLPKIPHTLPQNPKATTIIWFVISKIFKKL
jgi:hypothetical protein